MALNVPSSCSIAIAVNIYESKLNNKSRTFACISNPVTNLQTKIESDKVYLNIVNLLWNEKITCVGMQASIAGRLGNTKEIIVRRVQMIKIHLPKRGICAQKV